MVSPSDARKMLDELDEEVTGFSSWERNFIESLLKWDGPFTPAQSAKLEDIWTEHFGGA